MSKPSRKIPTVRQKVFQISVAQPLVEWWEKVVEPAIKKSGKTRSAYIMQAVREKVERNV